MTQRLYKTKDGRFRSGLEAGIARQLKAAGIPYEYEAVKIPYIRNRKLSRYCPDFVVGGDIILEAKGYFVAGLVDADKLIRVVTQHDGLDLRIIYQDATKKLQVGGEELTYAEWTDRYGLKWTDGGKVPDEWLDEIKARTILQ